MSLSASVSALGMLRDAQRCSRMLGEAQEFFDVFWIDSILGDLFHICHFWEVFAAVGML